MDNIQSKTTEHGDYQYDYDDLYRLTTVDNPVQQDDEAFSYDGVGNRLTSAETAGNWSYNQNNELAGYDDTSYVYDDNGNMTQKTVDGVVTNYVYNVEDRLAEVRDGSSVLIASYYYDPFGRRLWKEVGGTRTYFHYADEGLIGEYDSTGAEIKTYGYKPGSTWTTDPLFMKLGGEYYFYQNDHLGTPQKMTAVNGAVVWSAKYSSFGKAEIDPTSTVTNNLLYPGQMFDDETGLHYNYFRYYDANTGRYLRKDPIISVFTINYKPTFLLPALIKKGNKIHEYAYVLNNPLILIDPKGLAPNGCGPAGWKNKAVPENPFWMGNFQPACNNHDSCYEKCGAKKSTCDTDFYGEMLGICLMNWGWAHPFKPQPPHLEAGQRACEKFAKLYYTAVDKLGKEPFDNAQKCCVP